MLIVESLELVQLLGRLSSVISLLFNKNVLLSELLGKLLDLVRIHLNCVVLVVLDLRNDLFGSIHLGLPLLGHPLGLFFSFLAVGFLLFHFNEGLMGFLKLGAELFCLGLLLSELLFQLHDFFGG